MALLLLLLAAAPACPKQQFCSITGSAGTAHLFSVSSRAPDDVWASGQLGTVVHFNGPQWDVGPRGGRDRVSNVLAIGPDEAWTSDGKQALHWVDGAWHAVPLPTAGHGWGPVISPRPGVVWLLSSPPLELKGEGAVPVPESARALGAEEQGVLDADVCGPNDVWAMRSNHGTLVLAHWDGNKTVTLPRAERAHVGHLACVGGTAWVGVGDGVLRCTAKACEVIEAPRTAQLLKGPAGPYLIDESRLMKWDGKRFATVGEVPGEWYAGLARSDADVLLVGRAGATARFDGKTATLGAERVGRIRSISVAPDGEVWTSGGLGIRALRDGKWSANEAWQKLGGLEGALWVAGHDDVWAESRGRAWHWDGRAWKPISPERTYVRDLWGRGPKDVWLAGEAVWHWNGAKLEEVVAARPQWRYTRVRGDAAAVYVIAEGPRPEEADGPSTGKPDEIVVLKNGKAPERLTAAGRPDDLLVVNGELWTSQDRGLHRWVDGKWQTEGKLAGGRALVKTAKGFIALTGAFYAWEWDGQAVRQLDLPADNLLTGASLGETVWLAGPGAVLRRDP